MQGDEKMTDRFCLECACSGEPQTFTNPKTKRAETWREENWRCPLLGGNICETCCRVELAGGMGAPDTLRGMMKRTGKTAVEIHAVCLACPHGGPALDEPPKLISARDENGNLATSGPAFEAHDREFRKDWGARLGGLKKGPKDWWPRNA